MAARGIEDLRASFKPRRESTRVLFDQSLVARHRAATERHMRSFEASDAVDDEPIATDALVDLPNELAAIEVAIEAAEVEFVFQSMGRGRWLRLIAEHPAGPEDRRDGWEYARETFIPAALAATCVSHDLTFDDARWLAEELDMGEFHRLWQACHTANAGEAMRPKSVAASVVRKLNNGSWGTPDLEGSPEASS
jgi:hypothetical protein